MKKILVYPYQLWTWLVFAPYLAVSTALFAAGALLLVPIAGPRVAGRTCGVAWSRLICMMTPVWVRARGREHIEKQQSYVIVANHQSLYDIVTLYGWLGIDFRWVMKKELRKVPALGAACEKLGHIFIDRSHSKKAVQSLEEAKRTVTGGTSVIFFPEGTRSKTGKLGVFKKGAFKMACELGLPVLPVTVNGTREILKTQSVVLFPGRATLTVHPAVPSEGKTERELLNEVRSVMEESLSSSV